MTEVRERPPSILKTSKASSLGGDDKGTGAPTTYLEDVDGSPREAMPKTRERPPPILKTSMAGPLGGIAGDPGAPTTYLEDVDGGRRLLTRLVGHNDPGVRRLGNMCVHVENMRA
jgi:hypothetical protein